MYADLWFQGRELPLQIAFENVVQSYDSPLPDHCCTSEIFDYMDLMCSSDIFPLSQSSSTWLEFSIELNVMCNFRPFRPRQVFVALHTPVCVACTPPVLEVVGLCVTITLP